MFRISGFVDDVMFSRNGATGPESKTTRICFVNFARQRHRGRSLPSPAVSCHYYSAPVSEVLNAPLLTVDGESEDVAGVSLVVECRSEALRRDERFDQVSHHVNLRLFVVVILFHVHPAALAVTAAGRRKSVVVRIPDDGRGGRVRPSTSKILSLTPDDRVLEQVEVVSDELTLETDRLTGVQCPRLGPVSYTHLTLPTILRV